MEPVADKLKSFYKSTEEFFTKGFFHKQRDKSSQYNPIEMLKRLQREAFSDIMKLRDRQEKVEKMLTFYKTAKGSPFQEFSTHVNGTVNMAGALILVDEVDEHNHDALKRAGVRTGINSRFTFETTIRQKDSFLVEFVANEDVKESSGNNFGNLLSLGKVMYSANVEDWLSSVIVPWGARCKDVAITSNPHQQERSLTDISSFGPPVLNQCHDAALGLMVKRANVAASLAELVSKIDLHPDSSGISRCFSTFGQVIYQLSQGTTLTLLGLHKRMSRTSQQLRLLKFTIPLGSLKHDASLGPRNADDNVSCGSMTLMLESELDESTRVGGWVEMKNSNPRCLQWAVSMSDTPEEGLGWGLSLGGIVQGPLTWDHFQAEAFLKLNVNKRCSLQPGIVYVMDGANHIPTLMFRSSWAL